MVAAMALDPPPMPSGQEELPIPNDSDHQLLGGARPAAVSSNNSITGLPCCGFEAVPTRRGLASSPALFLWESRTTSVDVMSVLNTTRPVVISSERRRTQVAVPHGVGAIIASTAGGRVEGGFNMLDSPVVTALGAQQNEARRAKRGRDLRRERQVFLSRLNQEREERVMLEAWAATRIQASFRGFLARPRPPRLRVRQLLTPAESNRLLVADLQAILARAGLPTIPGLGPDGRKAPRGGDWGQRRGVDTRDDVEQGVGWGSGRGDGSGGLGGRGLRRSRSRKHRAFEHEMGTQITKIVRGFLERRRYGRRRASWDQERRQAASLRIQRAWWCYRKRRGWQELESGMMDRAAEKIQARWRGMACRMALARQALEDALHRRKMVSAITIQTAARRRIVVARYGHRLTLGAARRQREARAAAEAARPTRRWNWGGPAPATGVAAAPGPRSGGAGATAGVANGSHADGGGASGVGGDSGGGGDGGHKRSPESVRGVATEDRVGVAPTAQGNTRENKPVAPAPGPGPEAKTKGVGVTFVAEVDRSRSETARRASENASVSFVQGSIEVAIGNARRRASAIGGADAHCAAVSEGVVAGERGCSIASAGVVVPPSSSALGPRGFEEVATDGSIGTGHHRDRVGTGLAFSPRQQQQKQKQQKQQ